MCCSGWWTVARCWRERELVAALVRSVVAFPPVVVSGEGSVLRAVERYETAAVDCAEAYLAALAEQTDGVVVSFDRDLDRIDTIHAGNREEPAVACPAGGCRGLGALNGAAGGGGWSRQIPPARYGAMA